MKKSKTTTLAKGYVSIGFDHGYRTAISVLKTAASIMPDEYDKDFLSTLTELLNSQAKSEKRDFFALVKFETDEDGIAVMKKK
jgi:hypothetical protein